MNAYGHCTVCQQPIVGDGGLPSDNAWLLTLVHTNGLLRKITVCPPCSDLSSGRLSVAWRNICEQHGKSSLDNDYREARGGNRLTEAQRVIMRSTLVGLVANPPIGILSARPWKEIRNERSA